MRNDHPWRTGILVIVIALLMVGLSGPVQPVAAQADVTATVTSLRAPLHEDPAAQSATVAELARGALVFVADSDATGNWVQVTTLDGVTGWVSAAHIHLNGAYLPGEGDVLYTVVDGSGEDWGRFFLSYEDAVDDSMGRIDLLAVRSYLNDAYLYILVEAAGDLDAAQLLLVDLVTRTGSTYSTFQYGLSSGLRGSLFVVTEEAGETRNAASVDAARSAAFEIRMPLDLLDNPEAVDIVAVRVQEQTAEGNVVTDELVQVMPAVRPLETEPVPNATIEGARVNLRDMPVNGRILAVLPPGTPISLLERVPDSTWFLVRLEDGALGWVTAEYVVTEVNTEALPSTE